MKRRISLLATLGFGLIGIGGIRAAEAAEAPLAVFEAREVMGINWPRTLITYELKAEGGKRKAESASRILLSAPVKPGAVKLVDAADGEEVPFQLSRVERAEDGTLESGRISFYAKLDANSSFHYELRPGKTSLNPEHKTPQASTRDGFLTLANGVTAIRLPRSGTHTVDNPLSWGRSHKNMVKNYTDQAGAGFIPGPIQGVRLADDSWAGGSYFLSSKADGNPMLERMTCQVVEEGPLFIDARVRYEFRDDAWYEMAVRMKADDPALEIDEQFDFRETGHTWARRLVVSLSAGWREGGWKPDVVYGVSPENKIKRGDADFMMVLDKTRFESPRKPFTMPLSYSKSYQQVCNFASWYPWHRDTAYYFRTLDLAED